MSEETNHIDGDKPAVPSNPLLASAIGLLRIARCPDCEGEGWYVREVGGCDSDGENDTRECIQEQCQWCWERDRVLAEYDKANPTLHRGEPTNQGENHGNQP